MFRFTDQIRRRECCTDTPMNTSFPGRGMSGSGIAQDITSVLQAAKLASDITFGPIGTAATNVMGKAFNKNPNWRPGFAGEKHILLPTVQGLTPANYAGPGTNLSRRLARGDRGVDGPQGIDEASRRHDISYSQATTAAQIRQADNVFLGEVESSNQSRLMKNVVKGAMRAKLFAEDVNLIDPSFFSPQLGEGLEDLPMEALKRKLMKKFKNKKKIKQKLSAADIAFLKPLIMKMV